MIKDQIEADLKEALLARDSIKSDTLKGIKSAIKNAEIESGKDLGDDDITKLLAKQLKQRQEAAELYTKGGSPERAEKETKEAAIIQAYLPEPLSEEELRNLIKTTMDELQTDQMGQIIGAVNRKAAGRVDGGTVARLVKEALGK